jgi:hypothetical protein
MGNDRWGAAMHRQITLVLVVLVLSGCGDPLANTPKLSDVELAAETPVLEVLPAPEESMDSGGFFKRLMRKRTLETTGAQALPESEPSVVTTATDPDIDVAIAEATPVPEPKRRFWPFGRKTAPDQVVAAKIAPKIADPIEVTVEPVVEFFQDNPDPTEGLIEPEKRRKLFGFLRAKPKLDIAPEVLLASLGPIQNTAAPTQLDPEPVEANAATPAPRRGLLGRLLKRNGSAKLTGPDALDVPFGAALPYGEIGRVCGVKSAQLGKEVAKYPERRPLYRLYDSDPGNIDTHVFYLTGFPDGCARIFSAAMALFGSPVMHERLRYGAMACPTRPNPIAKPIALMNR